MKEPEISTRITELKDEFQKETNEKLAQFDKHGKRLMALESEFGFDLDVATDIYGDALLDPHDAEKVVEQWANLLKSIKENPGGNLLFIRGVSVSTGIHSITHDPNLRYHERGAEAVLVPNVTLESFSYHQAKDGKQAYIAIHGQDIAHHLPYGVRGAKEVFVNPSENDDELIVATRAGLVEWDCSANFCITDDDCHILYDPSWPDARGLIDSVTDESYMFPVHFFDSLRHIKKSDKQKT